MCSIIDLFECVFPDHIESHINKEAWLKSSRHKGSRTQRARARLVHAMSRALAFSRQTKRARSDYVTVPRWLSAGLLIGVGYCSFYLIELHHISHVLTMNAWIFFFALSYACG